MGKGEAGLVTWNMSEREKDEIARMVLELTRRVASKALRVDLRGRPARYTCPMCLGAGSLTCR